MKSERKNQKTFGQTLRHLRQETGVSLRSLAKMVDRTPTYISKIERDELAPPAEGVIRDIARILKQDADDMLALAGRIPADLMEIIRQRPKEMTSLLRRVRHFSPEQLEEVIKVMNRIRNNKKKA